MCQLVDFWNYLYDSEKKEKSSQFAPLDYFSAQREVTTDGKRTEGGKSMLNKDGRAGIHPV